MREIAGQNFGALLRRARLDAGLSQEQLAERARLSVRGISDLERGARRRPHPATLRLLLDALAPPAEIRASLKAAARVALPGPAAAQLATEIPITRRVGRDGLVAEVIAALTGPDRLVSLVGPGGVGKTRVALAVAEVAATMFADGVLTVWLAPLRDPGWVAVAMARSAGIADSVDRPVWPRLLARLRGRQVLMVLDNFEHVLPGAPSLVALCAAAPRLRVLVTSRAVLHVSGERAITVPPLPLEEAAELFVQRARAAGQALDRQRNDVLEVCRRLECLPLAIELAAARTSVLSIPELLARLARRFDVLTGGPRDLPERQRTLRDTIGWSYDLLDEPARALLRRCSVCAGGWTLEATDAIYGAPSLDQLSVLVDHQLVGREPGGRFSMLETIREFAVSADGPAGEADAARRRLALHLLDLLADADRHLFGPDVGRWLDRVEAELPNLREMLSWALDAGELELGAGIASRLAWPWLIRGHLREGAGWLDRILAAAAELPPGLLGGTELGMAMLVWSLAEYGRAMEIGSRAAERLLAAGDDIGAATALNYVARAAVETARWEVAVATLQRAIALYSEAGHQWGVYFSHAQLARVEWARGHYGAATRRLAEWLPVMKERGDLRGVGFYQAYLSGVLRDSGDCRGALPTARASLEAFETIGDRRGTAIALIFLASAMRDLGELAAAGAVFRRCLELIRDIGPLLEIAWALEQVSVYELRRGRRNRAEILGRSAAAVRGGIGAPLPRGWVVPVRYRHATARVLGPIEALDYALDGLRENGG